MNIQKRINALRSAMAQKGIDIYIIPTADFHHSEYVGDYFKFREYITGFTGSAGTAVFTSEKAGLWTDGRYFIQAEQQLAGSGIELYRSGEPGVPSIEEFLKKDLQEGQVLGFDGRTISYEEGISYRQLAEQRHASVNFLQDLASEIWTDRPNLPSEPAFLLEDSYAGENIRSKLTRVRLKMKEYGCDTHILSSLDDIAWLFNIRGNDIAYCPLVLSYAIVYNDSVELFADTSKFSDTLLQLFAQQQIILHPYEEIYDTVSQFNKNQTVLLDSRIMNYSLYRKIPEFVPVVDRPNPEILMKCIKNDVQVENLKAAHLKDGIAHTRFMYWLKTNSGEFPVTELSASQKLEEFRAMQDEFIGPSFAPISAYGEHGAIVHYSADEESNVELKPGKLFMTDTGGHYLQGSTDITRTVAIGEAGHVGKEHFTLVVRAMLRLANTVFLHGCSGANLDCIAREVFWKKGLNFNHGTGHGVGYLLNIHEGPISFRWKEGKTPSQTFEKNMVITDEPGIYMKDSHGIRIENELLVTEADRNEYGQFMKFEVLTLVPIDLDALLPEQMTSEEREQLNNYHQLVYEKISPYLPEAEREWLKYYTRAV
ncbi:aminopeptidase P family protein [Mediterraneibacter sp.]